MAQETAPDPAGTPVATLIDASRLGLTDRGSDRSRARKQAVYPLNSTWRAPCCFRKAAVSWKPFFSAAARGVTPALLLALMSAPRATRSSTSDVLPHAAAW